MRVFDDGAGGLWWELETGLFWIGRTEEKAQSMRNKFPRHKVTEGKLREWYPNTKEVTRMNIDKGGTPALDEVISTKPRVISDGLKWFELSPGLFWCGTSWANAEEIRHHLPEARVDLRKLLDAYPNAKDITNEV